MDKVAIINDKKVYHLANILLLIKALNFRGVMIHRCIAMHRYFITTICIDMVVTMYHGSHETICTSILEKHESKHIIFVIILMEIL